MKSQQGQSLFEVVIALAVISLVLIALISLSSLSIRNSSFSRDRTLSTRLAQEMSEWLRGERDKDWDTFLGKAQSSPIWCLPELSWGFPSKIGSCGNSDLINKTSFKREVSFTVVSSDRVDVNVKVYWTDSQGYHESRSSTYFTNWRTD